MKFKEYPKKYENYFFRDPKTSTLKRYDYKDVGAANGWSFEEYRHNLALSFWEMEKSFFDDILRLTWLFNQFSCAGQRRKSQGNGKMMDYTFSCFMREMVGFDQVLLLGWRSVSAIKTYIYDWFPRFDDDSPFEVDYAYPYKNMNFECIILVYRMSERLELLKIGEERNMTYPEFFNYVVNYIFCYNEENGEVYAIDDSRSKFQRSFIYIKPIKQL